MARANPDACFAISSASGWRLNVGDSGPGLPENELHNIFQPFYRSSSHIRRDGSGLGLAIAKLAIELHNGDITAENNIDGGLCISIIVPGGKRTVGSRRVSNEYTLKS